MKRARHTQASDIRRVLSWWLLLVIISISLGGSVTGIASASSPKYCENAADTFQGMWEANSNEVILNDPKMIRDAISIVKTGAPRIADCTPGPLRDYARAYNEALAAAILHRIGKPWITAMNLADQLLAKCITNFYGTERGAQCQTDMEINIHRKLSWHESGDYAGPPVATPRPRVQTLQEVLKPMPLATIAPPPPIPQ